MAQSLGRRSVYNQAGRQNVIFNMLGFMITTFYNAAKQRVYPLRNVTSFFYNPSGRPNAVLRFISERSEVDEFRKVTKARSLYQAYRRSATMTEDYCSTETWFGRLLTLKGYKKKRQMDGLYYEGLTLKEPEQTTTDEEPRWRE